MPGPSYETVRRWREANPWYNSLRAARDRCTQPSHDFYDEYGGRGIKCLLNVEEIRWLWFLDNADAMERPSLDRLDADKSYTFDNVRFLELADNVRECNRRKPRVLRKPRKQREKDAVPAADDSKAELT